MPSLTDEEHEGLQLLSLEAVWRALDTERETYKASFEASLDALSEQVQEKLVTGVMNVLSRDMLKFFSEWLRDLPSINFNTMKPVAPNQATAEFGNETHADAPPAGQSLISVNNPTSGGNHTNIPSADGFSEDYFSELPALSESIDHFQKNSAARRASLTNLKGSRGAPVTDDNTDLGMSSPALHFCDTEQIKDRVRRAKLKPVYDVKTRYHETGCVQRIVKDPIFEQVTMLVIFVNALWISIDTDLNKSISLVEAEFQYVVADVAFFSYFMIEVLLRFMAFKSKRDCLKDGWFMFDTALVMMYAIDPFIMSLIRSLSGGKMMNFRTEAIRLLRLARLTRLSRLLCNFQELVIMCKGIVTATATVGYTLGLLALTTYVFVIAIRSMVPAGSMIEEQYFPNVPEAMYRLLIHGTFMDDLSAFVLDIQLESGACLFLVWVYIVLSALGLMNMLIGILCEVISNVSTEEKEAMMIDNVKRKFDGLLHKFDANGDEMLSWDEFVHILESDECHHALKKVDVDLDALIDMAEDIFLHGEAGEHDVHVTFSQFISLVLDLRGSRTATVKDVMALGRRLNSGFVDVRASLDLLAAKMLKDGSRAGGSGHMCATPPGQMNRNFTCP